MIFKHGSIGESARIRRIVVGAIVIHGPVHELEIAIRPIGIQIKKVRQAHLPKSNFQGCGFASFVQSILPCRMPERPPFF
jgi:hypothetical protein